MLNRAIGASVGALVSPGCSGANGKIGALVSLSDGKNVGAGVIAFDASGIGVGKGVGKSVGAGVTAFDASGICVGEGVGKSVGAVGASVATVGALVSPTSDAMVGVVVVVAGSAAMPGLHCRGWTPVNGVCGSKTCMCDMRAFLAKVYGIELVYAGTTQR